ncbi:MAG: glycosyltransferase [Aggregatilineales bacterium]
MKKILILMSDTGGGHRAAAEAIRDALLRRHEAEVQLVDMFRSYTPFPFKYAPDIYPWLISHTKTGYVMGFKLSNSRRSARTLSRGMYVTMEGRVKQMLRDHPADVVVSVHSVLTRIAMEALMAQEKRPPFLVVVTDLVSTHMFWYDRRAERTLVPTQTAYDRGLRAGLRPDQMRITGLPVHPSFAESLTDKTTARAQLGWDPHLPAVLMVGGAEGMGPLYKNARAINGRGLNCQLAIVAGRNAALKEQLEETRWNQPTHIYGYVDFMPRLMAAADILITKGGPGTISEACIAGLPMIIYDAIPGQETGNVEYVVANRAGVFTTSVREVADRVEQWLAEGPQGLARRSEAARRIGRPNAVWEIAEEIWQYAQHPLIPTNRRTLWKEVSKAKRLLTSIGE